MDAQLTPTKPASTGHSSTVKMTLHIGTQSFPVLQACDNRIKVQDAAAIPKGDAILEISVDGNSDRWPVRVLENSPRTAWLAIEDR